MYVYCIINCAQCAEPPSNARPCVKRMTVGTRAAVLCPYRTHTLTHTPHPHPLCLQWTEAPIKVTMAPRQEAESVRRTAAGRKGKGKVCVCVCVAVVFAPFGHVVRPVRVLPLSVSLSPCTQCPYLPTPLLLPSLQSSSPGSTSDRGEGSYPEHDVNGPSTVPTDPPPFTLKQLRQAVPSHCFERDMMRSFGHMALDVVKVGTGGSGLCCAVLCGRLWLPT